MKGRKSPSMKKSARILAFRLQQLCFQTQPAKPLIWLGQELYDHHTDHWLHWKQTRLYGSRAADPTILQPFTNKIFRKFLYRMFSYIMYQYVIKTWTLSTTHFTTEFLHAKEETRPQGWHRREAAAKLLLKMPTFLTSNFLCSKHIHILFSKTPGFWLQNVQEFSSPEVQELSSKHFSGLKKVQEFSPNNICTYFLYIAPFTKISIKVGNGKNPVTFKLSYGMPHYIWKYK